MPASVSLIPTVARNINRPASLPFPKGFRNCLTVSNLKLDDVFSNVFGKSARSITAYMLDHPGEPFDVSPFVDRRCKTPVSEIQAAVDGAASPEQAVKLRQCLAHIDELEAHRREIEREILLIAEPFSAILDFLYTLPGLDRNPMTTTDQSNSKVKSTRISRAGCYLKPLLVQLDNALINSKKHPEFRERYLRIKSHRGHKKAIIAVC